MMRRADFKVDRAILFAPALSLKTTSYLVNFFKIFGDRFIVPSFSVEEYRAQSGTSMGAYRCLFDAVKRFEKGSLKNFSFPTLILMSPKDRLVSYEGIKELSKNLGNLKMVGLDNSKSLLEKKNHHLVIDKQSLGIEEWDQKVVKSLDLFLGK
jgi:alpha-beta hydrolase superfamily lysophospholipase